MFEVDSLSAHRFMRPKTICLTFDDGPGDTYGDGPGPKTLRLAQYLNSENIVATFFFVGKHIIKYPDVVKEVASLGHIIGSHTFCHCDHLPILLSKGWDIASEILMTDELIKEYNPNGTIYFRAPWGAWSPDVAYDLNKNVKNGLKHIGPIFWDIESNDFGCWNEGKSAHECADAHYQKIIEVDRGILIMHDSTADILKARNNNWTFETMQILIPRLKAADFKFVGLDKIFPAEV